MLALAANDLGELNQPGPLLIPHPTLVHPRTQRPLAIDRVRYAGEAVAFVVAESRYAAEDALDLIDVEYVPLAAAIDLDTARTGAPTGPRRRTGQRVRYLPAESRRLRGGVRRRRPSAARTRDDRAQRRQPIEARGVVAHWDAHDGTLTAWISTQAPLPLANGLAGLFGLPENKVRVVAPDVGGGFGTKIMMFYPEEILVPFASIRLQRPVRVGPKTAPSISSPPITSEVRSTT